MSTPDEVDAIGRAYEKVLDLGAAHWIEKWFDDDLGHHIGFVENHPDPRPERQGKRCSGFVRLDTPEGRASFKGEGAFWQVISSDPLTLVPSLLCRWCGDHGFIREGKWVPV